MLHAAQVTLNLKKARGTIDRVLTMLGEKKYCIDLAQQCNAAIGLIRNANNLILESHLHTCGPENLTSKNPQQKEAFIKELVRAFTVASRK
jgi:DNA-binding FrmR family transcriptional regulator